MSSNKRLGNYTELHGIGIRWLMLPVLTTLLDPWRFLQTYTWCEKIADAIKLLSFLEIHAVFFQAVLQRSTNNIEFQGKSFESSPAIYLLGLKTFWRSQTTDVLFPHRNRNCTEWYSWWPRTPKDSQVPKVIWKMVDDSWLIEWHDTQVSWMYNVCLKWIEWMKLCGIKNQIMVIWWNLENFEIAKPRKITTMGVMFPTDSLSKHASDMSRPIQEEDGTCFQKLSLVTPVSDEEFGSNHLAGEFVLSCWALNKLRCQNGRGKRSGAFDPMHSIPI